MASKTFTSKCPSTFKSLDPPLHIAVKCPRRTVVETFWGSFPPQSSHKHQDKNPPNYGVNERSEAGIKENKLISLLNVLQ